LINHYVIVICRYSNGDVYKGEFVDGKKQGHGLLKQGKFTASLANMYIGQWQADKRHGYGVCDDIPRGLLLILYFHFVSFSLHYY
jgi:MORN repeat